MDIKKAQSLTSNLSTKSDKIRTLADAGYSRSDIAKFLEIRYQHVRNVLTKSSLVDSISSEPFFIDILSGSGFEPLGEWVLDKSGKLSLSSEAPKKPAVYAFVINKIVMYVGVSSQNLSQRFYFYIRPGPRQKTSQRLNEIITSLLQMGRSVEIFYACPEDSSWNSLPVDTVTGLESGLIKRYKPEWNKRGK